jgi:4-hydroxy-tetrahydrodipicolinate synthase
VIKAALHAQGRIPTPGVRLPLLPAAPASAGALLARVAGLPEPQLAAQPG